jgi:hypothetical protein
MGPHDLYLSVLGQSFLDGVTQLQDPSSGAGLQLVKLGAASFNNGVSQTKIRGFAAPLFGAVIQTQPGNAGHLVLVVSNKENPFDPIAENDMTSGFSVAAIPIKMTLWAPMVAQKIKGDIYGPLSGVTVEKGLDTFVRYGVNFETQPTSDSGQFNDLDKVTWTENLIRGLAIGSENGAVVSTSNGQFSRWIFGDFHGFEVRIPAAQALANPAANADWAMRVILWHLVVSGGGQARDYQTWEFADARTGTTNLPMANSSFKYLWIIQKVGILRYEFSLTSSPWPPTTEGPGELTPTSPNIFQTFFP